MVDAPPLPGTEVPPAPPKRGPGRPKGSKIPPKRPTGGTPPTTPRSPGRPSNDDKLREQIVDFYLLSAGFIGGFSPSCGAVVEARAERCADAWVTLAKRNPRVRRLLESAAEGGGWVGLFMAHAPILGAVYTVARTGEPTADSPTLADAFGAMQEMTPDQLRDAMQAASSMFGGGAPPVDFSARGNSDGG